MMTTLSQNHTLCGKRTVATPSPDKRESVRMDKYLIYSVFAANNNTLYTDNKEVTNMGKSLTPTLSQGEGERSLSPKEVSYSFYLLSLPILPCGGARGGWRGLT